jgi:hypothetical protein
MTTRVGAIMRLRSSERDTDPWYYLVTSLHDDAIGVVTLHATKFGHTTKLSQRDVSTLLWDDVLSEGTP